MKVGLVISLLFGWLLDLCLGDPARLPHPIVGFGKAITACEHRFNYGSRRKMKGAIIAIVLIVSVFAFATFINYTFCLLHYSFYIVWNTLVVFFCLAGTTLIREVRDVFLALERSLEEGRRQVSRIVGRDTNELSAQEVRTAALETLSENLSDGVVAPLFWFALLGAPGMLAYKMINTLDSMIGYRTERYKDFGCVAAYIDDIANYIPARLTALLMILPQVFSTFRFSLFAFVRKNGCYHASPNSGFPEAALAGILNCRFGGPHYYFGELFDKPYIGDNDRALTTDDMLRAVRVNRITEILMIVLTAFAVYFNPLFNS